LFVSVRFILQMLQGRIIDG